MNRVVLFVLLFLFWVLLTWTPDTSAPAYLQEIGVGLAMAALVTWIMGAATGEKDVRWFQPKRYGWALVYAFVLAAYVIKANVEVAYRVLHPAMPIRPGLLKLKTRLRGTTARTVLGNSITLTPGTLTVDLRDDGVLMVHWLYVRTLDEEEAAQQIIGRFEWFIERIFE